VSADAEAAAWVPTNDRQRPPFEPGNTVAVRHGAFSPRLVSADTAQLLEDLRVDGADWIDQVDAVALEAWMHAEAVCRRLRAWLAEHGHLDGKGEPRRASGQLLAWERRASSERVQLGVSPLARSRIDRDTAVGRAATAGAVLGWQRAGAESVEAARTRGVLPPAAADAGRALPAALAEPADPQEADDG